MLGGSAKDGSRLASRGTNSRAKPEPRAKPEKKRGRGLGRGLGEPLPRNFFKFITWNRAIWCIADAKIEGYKQITFLRFEEHSSSKN